MATDNHLRVLFNEGEGVDPDDINLAQSQLYWRLTSLLTSALPAALGDPTSPGNIALNDLEEGFTPQTLSIDLQTNRVYVPFPNTGFVYCDTITANRLTVTSGTIGVFLDEPFGSAEAFALIDLPQTNLTTAAGDATNPRLDVVVVTAAWADGDPESRDFEDAVTGAKTTTTPDKTRRVVFTLALVQGTPAATPVIPALTANQFVLGVIRVPATHNAVHSSVDYRDMRWPLGKVRVYDTPASSFFFAGTNKWAVDGGFLAAFANNTGTDDTYVPAPHGSKCGRLVGIGIYGVAGASAAADLVRVKHNLAGGPTVQVLADLMSVGPGGTMFDAAGFRVCDVFELADSLLDPDSAPSARLANTPVGSPMWMSSWPAGVTKASANPENPFATLAVRLRSEDVAAVSMVRWYVLEGL